MIRDFADEHDGFLMLSDKELTLLAFTIPKFGNYILNFYTAYRLRYRVELGIEM